MPAARACAPRRGDPARLREALQAGGDPEIFGTRLGRLRQRLESLSRSRAAQGQSAGDTSAFVLAFKRPSSAWSSRSWASAQQQMALVWIVTQVVDKMAQWTVTTYQQTREEIIKRQQQDLLELSTPVIKLFEGVLAVP
jgi:rsbT co-antagonist protein RsbR